jgi:hypothetical protein
MRKGYRKPPETKEQSLDRFYSFISPEPNTGCWIWMGSCGNGGYGGFYINRRRLIAHRIGYELLVGRIPKGLEIDHRCRVRCCVNPDHLEPVTRKENIRRGLRGILTTHCPRGHEYNESNTYWKKTPTGRGRHCKACWKGRTPKRENHWYAIQRAKTHCPRGHEYSPENTYVYNGSRTCRKCGIERTRRRRNAIKQAMSRT